MTFWQGFGFWMLAMVASTFNWALVEAVVKRSYWLAAVFAGFVIGLVIIWFGILHELTWKA